MWAVPLANCSSPIPKRHFCGLQIESRLAKHHLGVAARWRLVHLHFRRSSEAGLTAFTATAGDCLPCRGAIRVAALVRFVLALSAAAYEQKDEQDYGEHDSASHGTCYGGRVTATAAARITSRNDCGRTAA